MATKKASAKKSTSSRTTAAKKTAPKKTVKPTSSVAARSTATKTRVAKVWPPKNLAGIILSEAIGTLILTLVAITTVSFGVWYVGVALIVLVMALGSVSGTHVNPAVTLGLWAVRKISWKDMLVYIGSQILGAMFAVVLLYAFTGGSFGMNFNNFLNFSWPLFGIELVATAVFLFGLVAVLSREGLSLGLKAAGIGLSLTVGLVAGGTLLDQVKANDYTNYQKKAMSAEKQEAAKLPRSLYVKGVVANPAIALATTENTESQFVSGSVSGDEVPSTRFALDLLLGTLVGGVLGALLFKLVNYRPRD